VRNPHGVTITQWRYLRELWEEDTLTIGELTAESVARDQQLWVAVQLLEKGGASDLDQVDRGSP